MKICWDNLENIRLTKNGNFRTISKGQTYYYVESCKGCGEPFLRTYSSKGSYCSHSCSNNGKNNPFYGKHHSEEIRRKLSKSHSGENGPNYGKTGDKTSAWKGGYYSNNIPMYDTYVNQIDWVESVRRNKEDKNILEVKCTKCGKWHVPTLYSLNRRIKSLKGKLSSGRRLYCSDECKQECSIYNKSPEQLMKEDAVKAGRLSWLELGREVQPELRQMVLERDDHQCIKCGNIKNLHCHHIEGVRHNPLMSADVDICITLCKSCHIEVHKQPGCGTNDMKCAA